MWFVTLLGLLTLVFSELKAEVEVALELYWVC